LGQGDSSLFKYSVGVIIMTMPLKGTHFYIGLYSKTLETSFFHESLVWMH